MRSKIRAPLLALLIVNVLVMLLGFFTDAYVQLNILFIVVNVLMALSLNLVNGFTGQFSLGHAGFMAVGAYTAVFFVTKIYFAPGLLGLFLIGIYSIAGGLLAALAGYLVGLPSLRLRGDYLAIVTLGFGEIIRVVLLNMEFLGGPRGIAGIPPIPSIQIGSFEISSFYVAFFYASSWAVVCFFSLWRLCYSQYGLSFLGVREDEIAAEAMGVPTTKVKVRAFVLSSFFAGVAGSLMAHFTSYISPASFSFLLSVNAVIMVVLGGMGSLTGSILAAAIITVLPEALRPLQEITGVDLRMVIYALALVLIMIIRPTGLFGDREWPEIWRSWKTTRNLKKQTAAQKQSQSARSSS